MGGLLRFGVSMDAELLTAFDDLIEGKGYANRSEALRDLVRDAIIESRGAETDTITAAALCLVSDSQSSGLSAKLSKLQQDFSGLIVSTLHVQLDSRNGLDVIVLRGRACELRGFADRVLAMRGVRYGDLVLTGSGDPIEGESG